MKLSEFIQASTASPTTMRELFIRESAEELFRLFIDYVISTFLHYEENETLRGFFHCLGEKACPYCRAGFKSKEYILLPVYSVGMGCVAVLKMPNTLGAFSLLSQIRRHLDDPEIAQKILIAKKDGKFKYIVEARPAGQHCHLGSDQIAAFERAHLKGEIDLSEIFPRPTAEDMRAVPSIALKLEILNGHSPHPPESSL